MWPWSELTIFVFSVMFNDCAIAHFALHFTIYIFFISVVLMSYCILTELVSIVVYIHMCRPDQCRLTFARNMKSDKFSVQTVWSCCCLPPQRRIALCDSTKTLSDVSTGTQLLGGQVWELDNALHHGNREKINYEQFIKWHNEQYTAQINLYLCNALLFQWCNDCLHTKYSHNRHG